MQINEQQQNQRQADRLHPWWQSPLLGYPCAVLFATLAFLVPWSTKALGLQDYVIEPPFVMATLAVGWLWGIGPALLTVLVGMLALDYWILPPTGVIDFFLWPDIASFAPFVLIQLLVLWMVVVQKRYRHRLLQANEQLVEAHRVKDRFFAMASHELRTPVTSIRGYVQLLERRLQKQSVQHPGLLAVCDTLGEVDAQTQRLMGLMNELLDISTLRSGKMPMRLAPCDLCVLCQRVVEEQRALTGRQIELTLSGCPLMLQADEGRLAQVAINLISNALKYAPAHMVIGVQASPKAGEAVLAVHNESPVLSKAQQETIFEPFYRSLEAHCSATSGWGLGPVCKSQEADRKGYEKRRTNR